MAGFLPKRYEKFQRDTLGVVWCALGAFSMASVLTYSPQDPSLNSIVSAVRGAYRVKNACGYIGSFMADILLQSFGAVAFLIPIVIFFHGVLLLRARESNALSLRTLMGAMALVLVSGVIALHAGSWRILGGQIPASGFLGLFLTKGLVGALAPMGVAIALWSGLVLLLIYLTEVSLADILARIGLRDAILKLLAVIVSGLYLIYLKCAVQPARALYHWFSGLFKVRQLATPARGAVSNRGGEASRQNTENSSLLSSARRAIEQLVNDIKGRSRKHEAGQANSQATIAVPGVSFGGARAISSSKFGESRDSVGVSNLDGVEDDDQGGDELAVGTSVLSLGQRPENSSGENHIAPGQKRKVKMLTKVDRRIENWKLPELSMLEDPPASRLRIDEKEIRIKSALLVDKLMQFDVRGEVVAAKPGPAVTLYEFRPSADVKISKITELADDLRLALSSESVRIIAPIPGRDVVGIETANAQRETVYLKDVIAQPEVAASPWPSSQRRAESCGSSKNASFDGRRHHGFWKICVHRLIDHGFGLSPLAQNFAPDIN
jgi:DNA segregation ATPase FtsK/SpoIIIE, S-DNA-T family